MTSILPRAVAERMLASTRVDRMLSVTARAWGLERPVHVITVTASDILTDDRQLLRRRIAEAMKATTMVVDTTHQEP